jgi:hypothetical protein
MLIAFGRDHDGMHGDLFSLDSLLQDEIMIVCSINNHQVCAAEELCRVAQRVHGARFCEAQGGAVRNRSRLSRLLPVPCQCVSRFFPLVNAHISQNPREVHFLLEESPLNLFDDTLGRANFCALLLLTI